MEEQKSFRDSIATVDEQGKRIWIFPKKPFGKYYDKRKLLSYLLLLLLFSGPFLRIGGEPVLMFNVLERKFIIFGQIFWPQDLHLFALAMIAMVIFIALFTVVFGRLFCGWICPQTIFMEMVFRRIEYWIEGDWKQQKKLKKAPWNAEKIRKKTIKHVIFWTISFLIANTFLAYIIGNVELFHIVTDNPMEHITGLISIVIFTTVFYLVFSKMREQVCTVVCPYGRLQGVLLDSKSLVVAYDYARGENRARFRKNEDRQELGKGDCIDCKQCVHVCPTGIDIRNGTQLECINCTACMDACDHMMESVGLEKGLIRYASEDGIKDKAPWKLTLRMKAYIAVLFALLGLLGFLIVGRSDFETTILRTRGSLYNKVEKGVYSNVYDVTLVNKTNDDMPIEIKIIDGIGELQPVGDPLFLHAQAEVKGKFIIIARQSDFTGSKTPITLGIYGNGELIEEVETTFLGPSL
ncbi:cytochrome c oxidase accessory protein CcoG [bacterium SCSIO 12741]|nr:cytochrome c oxidase accessory protein CcoG [bacterium SCSIO 12741]